MGSKKEKNVIAKTNSALLLITEGIFLLDMWKCGNSRLIRAPHYVPFNVHQTGIFTSYLTGKSNTALSLRNKPVAQLSVEKQ